MSSVNRRSWLAFTGTAALGGLATQASAQAPAKKPLTPREAIQQHYLPNLLLTTHEGKKVRFYDDLVKDRVVLINMMYAECQGVCPGITANLAKVYKRLGDRMGRDILMLSITLRPERDTPKALKHYAGMHKAGPGWLFLTGMPADIELLRRSLGFVDPDPVVDKDKSNHIGNIRFGNEPRMLWAACPGMATAESIAETVLSLDPPKAVPAAAANGKGERR